MANRTLGLGLRSLLTALVSTGCFTPVAYRTVTRPEIADRVFVRSDPGATLRWRAHYAARWRQGVWQPKSNCDVFTAARHRTLVAIGDREVALRASKSHGPRHGAVVLVRAHPGGTCVVEVLGDHEALSLTSADGTLLEVMPLHHDEGTVDGADWFWLGLAIAGDVLIVPSIVALGSMGAGATGPFEFCTAGGC